ncbi:MAG: hypothetical protein AAF845_05690 [Bacteroidota bacterium]
MAVFATAFETAGILADDPLFVLATEADVAAAVPKRPGAAVDLTPPEGIVAGEGTTLRIAVRRASGEIAHGAIGAPGTGIDLADLSVTVREARRQRTYTGDAANGGDLSRLGGLVTVPHTFTDPGPAQITATYSGDGLPAASTAVVRVAPNPALGALR